MLPRAVEALATEPPLLQVVKDNYSFCRTVRIYAETVKNKTKVLL